MRRWYSPVNGKQYLGNTNTMEVHDLDNEKVDPNQCQIDKIIYEHHARTFSPDSLKMAKRQGYDHCKWCFDSSQK